MEALSEDKVTATFDHLVQEGVIAYGPSTVIDVDANGYPLEFRICPSLSKKPNIVGEKLDPILSKGKQWGPGSDMFCPDPRLIITQLNGTHDLAYNLFCVDRPQLLLLTLDSYRRQHEPMDLDDFKVALHVLTSLKSMYVIFNCSEKGGCSRVHKHLQALKGPPKAFHLFVSASSSSPSAKNIPFKYFMQHFKQGFDASGAEELLSVYKNLLNRAREALSLGDGDVVGHNVVLWKDVLIVIPRSQGMVGEGASANAGGMMGTIWLSEEKSVELWRNYGYARVLSDLGVPKS